MILKNFDPSYLGIFVRSKNTLKVTLLIFFLPSKIEEKAGYMPMLQRQTNQKLKRFKLTVCSNCPFFQISVKISFEILISLLRMDESLFCVLVRNIKGSNQCVVCLHDYQHHVEPTFSTRKSFRLKILNTKLEEKIETFQFCGLYFVWMMIAYLLCLQ